MRILIAILLLGFEVSFALIRYHCGSGPSTNYAENNLYADGIHLEGKSSITFQLKGGHDAHILLQHDHNNLVDNVIEIVLGGWGNSKSVIRSKQQQEPPRAQHVESRIISPSSFKYFWISWSGSYIRVGKGETIGHSEFMSWNGLSFSIKAISISFGFGNGGSFKFECRPIENCVKVNCSNARESSCVTCIDKTVFYKVSHDKKSCERMCSFDANKCWPGECRSGLATNCKCLNGFKREAASCQLSETTRPTVNKCFTTIIGHNLEKVQTTAGQCHTLHDLYGHFKPVHVNFDIQSDFMVNVSTIPRPKFIHSSNFGVTDTRVIITRVQIDGKIIQIGTKPLETDLSKGTNVKHAVFYNDTINLQAYKNYSLSNGERLCLHYESLGGGFVTAFDTRSNKVLDPVSYKKSRTIETVCFIYDTSRPKHCFEDKSCKTDPLFVEKRITRSKQVLVHFDGWVDKPPPGANKSSASGIDFLK